MIIHVLDEGRSSAERSFAVNAVAVVGSLEVMLPLAGCIEEALLKIRALDIYSRNHEHWPIKFHLFLPSPRLPSSDNKQ